VRTGEMHCCAGARDGEEASPLRPSMAHDASVRVREPEARADAGSADSAAGWAKPTETGVEELLHGCTQPGAEPCNVAL
jgi:hypothetical protein